MSKLYDLNELVEATGLPERTVRYYLAKVLEAPSGTPGRKSYYDQLTLDQLRLAQQILAREYDPDKGEVKPTLTEFREWLDGLASEQIHHLAQMPYRINPMALTARSATFGQQSARLNTGDDSFDGLCMSVAGSEYQRTVAFDVSNDALACEPGDTASEYLDRVASAALEQSVDLSTTLKAQPSQPGPQWTTWRFGDHLEIRTRKALSQQQRLELELAGRLLQNIVERTN